MQTNLKIKSHIANFETEDGECNPSERKESRRSLFVKRDEVDLLAVRSSIELLARPETIDAWKYP